jgi:uncharacterized protein with von Willebrand factor type A (vWA) domain
MYPFGSLPSNLVAFAAVLRRDYDFRIGSGEVHEAARALAQVDLANERTVRDALRPILSRSREDAIVFDRAFTAFFFPGAPGARQPSLPPVGREIEHEAGRVEERPSRAPAMPGAHLEQEERPAAAPISPLPLADAEAAAALVGRASYSPLEAQALGAAPVLTPADAAWLTAARALVRRLQLGLSRRWRPAGRGRRFDLRRTLRASVQTGGEALTVRWLRRLRRTPRVVLLIDGSRSMEPYARAALQIAVALASVTMRVEVFAFSTALKRVTDDVRRAAAGETRRLQRLQHAWAGGTSIGPCLRDFLRRFGERMTGRETVVMICSDGLDVGAADTLQGAMRDLQRCSASIVWLNPLLETPGYEPIASGMRIARPYVNVFTSVNDAAGLVRLARMLRMRG